eukprot:TRINITY_DN2157_c0_g1_i1.p1 TRINITY_DN2157_c0_g1~~TRINITY_DN2157_c0_g1_i1.p1  ORF type:complete len:284 (-),score=57.95 TRINITY_DN2157_c0_g1_i1:49-900(-)
MASSSSSSSVLLLLVAVSFFCVAAAQNDVGFQLLHNFLDMEPMPLSRTSASQSGWKQLTRSCNPNTGYLMTKDNGFTKTNAYGLYFNEAGQIVGFATATWKKPASGVSDYWNPSTSSKGERIWLLNVMFRSKDQRCSSATSALPLGEQVSITLTKGGEFMIPLNRSVATNEGWVEGNCIKKMGIHYSFDIGNPGKVTNNVQTLLPLLPMYSSTTNQITAILVNSHAIERVYPLGAWEGPFPFNLFCKNWCADSGCKLPGTWSTMHWLFRNPADQKCTSARCKL